MAQSSVEKKKMQMRTAEQPAGQSAWQKSANSKSLSVWKLNNLAQWTERELSYKAGNGPRLTGIKLTSNIRRNFGNVNVKTEFRK